MTASKWTVVFAALCLSAVAASAEWQRTVWLDDTLTPDQGKLQTELWGSYGSAEDGDYTDMGGSLALYYGVMDNLSVEAYANYWSYDVDGGDSESGLGDTFLGGRFRFLEEAESAIDLAALGYVRLPTGDDDKGLGTGDVEPGIGLTAAKTLGQVVVVAEGLYNVITDAEEGEEDGTLYGGLEGAFMVSDQFNINAFIDIETARLEDGDEQSYAGVGARFLPADQWELFGSLAFGLSDAFYDWMANVAVGYEF